MVGKVVFIWLTRWSLYSWQGGHYLASKVGTIRLAKVVTI